MRESREDKYTGAATLCKELFEKARARTAGTEEGTRYELVCRIKPRRCEAIDASLVFQHDKKPVNLVLLKDKIYANLVLLEGKIGVCHVDERTCCR